MPRELESTEMPGKFSPPSLERLTTKKIADLVYDRNNCSLNPINHDKPNPFIDYPRILTNEIFHCFMTLPCRGRPKNEPRIHKDILRLFFSCKLEKLILWMSYIPENDWVEVLEMLQPNSSFVKIFKIRFPCDNLISTEKKEAMREYLAKPLCHLGSEMVNLLILDLHGIYSFDLFEAVARQCVNLKCLLGVSHSIPETTLKSLYMNPKDLSDIRPRCQNLKILDAESVNFLGKEAIVSNDCIMGLLNNLPKLSLLLGFNITRALNDAYERGKLCDKTFSLAYYRHEGSKTEILPSGLIISDVCPSITSLTLRNPSTEDYEHFRGLAHLMELRISNLDCTPDMFHRHLASLLRSNANNIRKMHLHIPLIDFFLISHLCPRLEVLACFYFKEVNESVVSFQKFEHLHTLSIETVNTKAVSKKTIEFLLTSCPNLQRLLLTGIDALTDSLLQEILRKNPFKNLREFDVWDSVTSRNPHINFTITRSGNTSTLVSLKMPLSKLLKQLYVLRNGLK